MKLIPLAVSFVLLSTNCLDLSATEATNAAPIDAAVELRLTVAGQSREAAVKDEGTNVVTARFGKFPIKEAGLLFGELTALVLDGLSATASTVLCHARLFMPTNGCARTRDNGSRSPPPASATTLRARRIGSTVSWAWRTARSFSTTAAS